MGGKMGKITKGMMTSNTYEWETPQDLFDFYDRRFCFDCDVCATEKNTKVPSQFFTKELNGLKQEWYWNNWMNPPYGRTIGKWLKKAYEESELGKLVVCLLPARTDTKWWQEYVMKSDSIHFIKGRLKFGGQTNSAPFPSAIAIFGLHYKNNNKKIIWKKGEK